FIRLLTSDIAFLILLVRKLSGGIRIYINYKGINEISLKNWYPLLLIKEMLNAICRLIIFIIRFGLYESLIYLSRLLRNFINNILYNIFDIYIITYLNNILIFLETYKDYVKYVREVL
ncbi:hypothetical protein NEUTE1DRAFT_45276, partial [Neurospora tetrasperma FGSC 2508]